MLLEKGSPAQGDGQSIRGRSSRPASTRAPAAAEFLVIAICASAGRGSSVVLRPFGDLDSAHTVVLQRTIHDLLEPGIDLTVDLGRVPFVGSAGLTVLAGTARRVRQAGGSMNVVNAQPRVRWRLDLVGLGESRARRTADDEHGVA